MKSNKLTRAFSGLGKNIVMHRPEIMLGIGIGGIVVSAFFIGYETPKFKKLLEEEKEKTEGKKIPVKNLAKTVVKCYGAPITGLIFSGASLGKGLYDVNKKNVALSAASAISEATTKELISKMKDEIGEEKTNKIVSDVRRDGVPMKELPTPGKRYIFEDEYTGVVFETTTGVVKDAFAQLERNLLLYDEVALTDLYWEIMNLDNRTSIDIPKMARRSYFTSRHMIDCKIPRELKSRYYPDRDEMRLVLVYEEPVYSDSEY